MDTDITYLKEKGIILRFHKFDYNESDLLFQICANSIKKFFDLKLILKRNKK